MTRIAPVRLLYNPKTLWFDALDFELADGQAVVVLTARGVELGHLAGEVFEADESQVKKLKSPLKPVKRLASDEDIQQAEEMKRRSAEALPVFKEMASEANSDMHPVSVEFLLDGDKAVFYFEAEERIDFRDLVRKLASHFHVRIDMRQIGVRDEARMVGGLGHCGQELCCKRLGGEFCPVSIRMAKEQDLSLNPQKISGLCGRLMCCLRYEFDAYKDFKSRAPKQNAMITTPEGQAKVSNLDVPREIVTLRTPDGKTVKVPLADLDEPAEEGTRPSSVGEDAWERATSAAGLTEGGEASFLTSQFTGSDQLGSAKAVRRGGSGSSKGKGSSKKGPGQGDGRQGQGGKQQSSEAGTSGRKPRRRRSTKVGSTSEGTAAEGAPKQVKKKQGGGQQKKKNGQQAGAKKQGQRTEGAKKQGAQSSGKARPGQKSSGLRQNQGAKKPSSQQRNGRTEGEGSQTQGQPHRKPRRRSHRTGSQGQGTSTNSEA